MIKAHNVLITLTFAIAMVAVSPIHAQTPNADQGKKLYNAKCGGCHDTKVHTRPNRIVHTYNELVDRVRFCDNAAQANLNENEIFDVTEYLNNAFYKFSKVSAND
ncbi:MAG: cytochrome c [Gammaproteobacteria bacterium]|nr:cytochrome c [Gammaproteobacteria bacterium]